MKLTLRLSTTAFAALLLCMMVGAASASCWCEAKAKYGVNPNLLLGVAAVESGLRPNAMNTSHIKKTNSVDIGLMQINSRWVGTLKRFGINAADLRNPCTNIKVGAWILSDLMVKHGDSWEAVGAYNAACTQLKGQACRAARSKYAWKVHQAMLRHEAAGSTINCS
jgi:soluble lytic murein transglycosylase-like protein